MQAPKSPEKPKQATVSELPLGQDPPGQVNRTLLVAAHTTQGDQKIIPILSRPPASNSISPPAPKRQWDADAETTANKKPRSLDFNVSVEPENSDQDLEEELVPIPDPKKPPPGMKPIIAPSSPSSPKKSDLVSQKAKRRVPSPVFGYPYVQYPIPMLEYTFPSSLMICRNPYHSSTHRLFQRPGSSKKRKALSGPEDENEFVQDDVFADAQNGASPSAKPTVEKKPKVVKKKKVSEPFAPSSRKPISSQELTAPKDISFANRTLVGLHDLTSYLSTRHCYWLGETLWIFTIQQLDYALQDEEKRAELISEVLKSNLFGTNEVSNSQKDQQEAQASEEDDLEQDSDSSIDMSGEIMPRTKARGVSKSPDPAKTSQTQPPPKHVAKLLEIWEEAVKEAKTKPHHQEPRRVFALKGPVSLLIPVVIRNFLETIKIETAFDYFSVKKTEASQLVVLFQEWRWHCELPSLKGYCLARYLLGMSIRLEKALTSVPAVDEYGRSWMGSALVILTGGARDFIISNCRVENANDFLNERTKEWSDRLVAWRARTNLPELKGSGKVAMVSGWKTGLKEALDVEKGEGRVLTEEEMLMAPPVDLNLTEQPKKKSTRKGGKGARKSVPEPEVRYDVETALNSPDFLGTVLRAENVKFLRSVGISSASQLIGADKQASSPAIKGLVKFRSEATAMPAQPATCVRLMYDWTQRVKQKIGSIKSDAVKGLGKKRGPRPKDDTDNHSEPNSYAPHTNKKNVSGVKKAFKNPMESLSKTTRTFLQSVGILTGEELLTMKTSVVSKKFIAWREVEKMAPLKGYGSIATVSGWKAQIRKAAKDCGDFELAQMGPENPGRTRPAPSMKPPDDVEQQVVKPPKLEPPSVLYEKDEKLLLGFPSRKFAVRAHHGADTAFLFELSVRRKASLHLTFLGRQTLAVEKSAQPGTDAILTGERIPTMVDCSAAAFGGDLQGSEVASAFPFSSDNDGCGLIDIGKYGARDPSAVCNIDNLVERVSDFLQGRELSQHSFGWSARHIPVPNFYDVYHRVSAVDGFQFFLYLSEPMEKGQTVEVEFGGRLPPMHFDGNLEEFLNQTVTSRTLIAQAISEQSVDSLAILANSISTVPGQSGVAKFGQSVFKRRLGWVVMRMLEQIKSIEKIIEWNSHSASERLPALKKKVDALQKAIGRPDNLGQDALRRSTNLSVLNEEAQGDVVASIIVETNILDCGPVAASVVEEVMRKEVFPRVAMGSEENRDGFVASLVETVKRFVNERMRTAELEPLVRPPGGMETATDDQLGKLLMCIQEVVDVTQFLAYFVLERWLPSSAPSTQFDLADVANHAVAERMLALDTDQGQHAPDKLSDVLKMMRFRSARNRGPNGVEAFLIEKRDSPPPSMPDSLPLFFGILWPTLQGKFGWRLEAGESAEDITFIPPGQGTNTRGFNDQAALRRQQRLQKRSNIQSRLTDIGIGYIPKLTKRLVVKSSSLEHESEPPISIKDILDKFKDHVLARCSETPGSTEKSRMQKIVDGIAKCLDEIIPLLTETTGRTIENLGCGSLIRILMVLPSVLQQSGLPFRQVTDTIETLKALICFVTNENDELFDENCRLPPEEYTNEEEMSGLLLVSRIKNGRDGDKPTNTGASKSQAKQANEVPPSQQSELIRDLILAEDVPDLTPFTVMAMRQFTPCRSTIQDVGRKGRRYVPVGFPGMVCKHCLGIQGEGKYFFSSLDSLGTAGGVIYSHLVKCSKIPEDQREKLHKLKSRHTEDRRSLRFGSQSAYFARLWKRLHSATAVGDSGVCIVQGNGAGQEDTKEASPQGDALSSSRGGFKSHLDVLRHIQRSSDWQDKGEVFEKISKYYMVIEYGGKLFHSSQHPRNFSSEWLLAKLVPNRMVRKKKTSMG